MVDFKDILMQKGGRKSVCHACGRNRCSDPEWCKNRLKEIEEKLATGKYEWHLHEDCLGRLCRKLVKIDDNI